MNTTERRIEGFQTKERGWHYGEGVAFGRAILDRAITLHREILRQGFDRTNAFPGLNGEVLVTAYCGKHYLEFMVELDDTVTFAHEIDDQEVDYRERLGCKEVAVIMARIGGLLGEA